jgi:hypothetical protein
MTRVWIATTFAMTSNAGDIAAVYVSLAWGSLMFVAHAIEFKLNKLLDQQGICVTDREIGRD